MEFNSQVSSFKNRLSELLKSSGLSQSAFAKTCKVDRSTLSLILSPNNHRLPRLENAMSIAQAFDVSVDWLLGLSGDDEAPRVQPVSLEITPGVPSYDELIEDWHREVFGQKVRYVPKTLPEILKTEQVGQYEYSMFQNIDPAKQSRKSLGHLESQMRGEVDLEVCNSLQALEGFLRGEGIWRDLPKKDRIRQAENMAELTEKLYPSFRWYLFDFFNHYSAPMTVFGSKRAVIFLGQVYFTFTSPEHIKVMSRHFDELIRSAVVHPQEVSDWISTQMKRLL